LITTLTWILVTFATKPENEAVLAAFYRKVRPHVTGWMPIAALAPEVQPTRDLGRNLWCWILGTVMVYSALFGVGKILLRHAGRGIPLVMLSAVCAWQMSRELKKSWSASEVER
jgi:solute:Na+ symporter, SSS family